MVLYRNGTILLYYNTLTGNVTSATVGIEDSTGTDGVQIVYNAAYLKNNLAVKISATPAWLSVSPATDTVNGGETSPVAVTFDATSLTAGTYTANLEISHNAPGDVSPLLVPCTALPK